MNTTKQLSESLQDAFERPTRGVVGLVDDLLRMCPAQGIQLDWQAERCRLRSVANGSEEVLTWPVPKSVFRAILARVATLCNERSANSVSPYGGQGELVVDDDPSAVLKAAFTNTTEEQKLELIPVPACVQGHVPKSASRRATRSS